MSKKSVKKKFEDSAYNKMAKQFARLPVEVRDILFRTESRGWSRIVCARPHSMSIDRLNEEAADFKLLADLLKSPTSL